jgi:5-methylcytosine-specific restriction enzyme A
MPKKPCATPGCPALVDSGRCDAHRAKHYATQGEERGSAHQRGYDVRWQKARRAFLGQFPLCCDPFKVHGPVIVPAVVVDHWIPHRGNREIFWDTSKWRGLCASCNGRKTAIDHGRSGEQLPEIPLVQPKWMFSR